MRMNGSLLRSACLALLLANCALALSPELSANLRKSFMKFANLGRDRPPLGTHKEMESPLLGNDQDICDICQLAIEVFVPVIETQDVYPKVVEFAKYLCKREHWFTDRVCDGAVDMFKDEIYAVLPVMHKAPHATCTKFLKLDCGTEDSPQKWWNVTIPDPPAPEIQRQDVVQQIQHIRNKKSVRGAKKVANTLQILHMSDLHMDPWYVPGSEGNCTEPLCCRADSPSPTDPAFRRVAGKLGDYNCDTPPSTMTAILSSIVQQHKIDAVYISGDYTPHDVWNQTRDRHKSTINTLIGMLKQTFNTTPVYMAVGNHEGMPVNAFPTPATSLPKTQNMSWLYDDILAANWITNTGWLPSITAKDISTSGSYSTLLKPGWRIISINDNYCNDGNWWLLRNTTDPQGVLTWLVDWLYYAENNQERVHIIYHIPTGDDGCLKAWSWNYYSIMYRFRRSIAAQFSGHTHDMYYTVYYDDVNITTPTGIMFAGPSITPYTNENPAYQLLTVDADTMEILDYDVYYVDLAASNKQGTLQINKLYSAKSEFSLPDLSPASWHQLAQRMQKDDQLFQKFYTYLSRLAVTTNCDAQCKRGVLCELVESRSNDPTFCDHVLPNL